MAIHRLQLWRAWQVWGVCLFVLLLTACAGSGGGTAVAPQGKEVALSLMSQQTGVSYDINMYLPNAYFTATAPLPVLYAMDSEYRYATLVGAIQQTGVDVVLVNVAAMSSARRWVDFTMPGATAYDRFLTLELIPFIEAQFKVDGTRRMLSGHSLSGEFVMYALFLDDPHNRPFWAYISEEGSFWYNSVGTFSTGLPDTAITAEQDYDSSGQLPLNLVMAGDDRANLAYVRNVYAQLTSRGYQGLNAVLYTYDLGHVPMDGPASAAALTFLLKTP